MWKTMWKTNEPNDDEDDDDDDAIHSNPIQNAKFLYFWMLRVNNFKSINSESQTIQMVWTVAAAA